MAKKVFIDGREGTTGLQIDERLSTRRDIEVIRIGDEKRKDIDERKRLINESDIVFLCLPDSSAREAVRLIENETTRVIDASTAHRTNPNWVYGFPELSGEQREKIKSARYIANPGCHATGFIAAVYPLVKMGILPKDYPLTCFSLTGYSGGGKKMIDEYEHRKTAEMNSPRIYALDLRHKHLPEMMYITGLTRPPVFCPIVDDYYNGLSVTVTLHNGLLRGKQTAEMIRGLLDEYYHGSHNIAVDSELGRGMLESNWGLGTNELRMTVSGNEEQTIITTRLDNLGKGAAGAAVQNMDLMLC